jgi:hypothetical protein
MPSAVVLIDRASVRSGDDSEICTRRIGLPVSAATTFPLIEAVPFSFAASRGGACASGLATCIDVCCGAAAATNSAKAIAAIIRGPPCVSASAGSLL